MATKRTTKLTGQDLVNGTLIFLLYIPTVLVFYLAFSEDYVPVDKYASIRLLVLLLFMPIIFKYAIQLVVAPMYPVVDKLRARKRGLGSAPTVSVLIPAWNEEVGIIKTIQSVIHTQYPGSEIIVINDGSTDNTHAVVSKFIEQYEEEHGDRAVPITYLALENGGKARALNAGLQAAKNEIIITVDADSVMDEHTIHNLVVQFADKNVASVAGNVAIGNRSKLIGLIQQLEYLYGFYFKRADSVFNAVYIVGGAAAAYRKDILSEVGGFDETMITEDIEISTRLQSYGYHVRYAPNAIVYTEGPSDFLGLCQQRLRWKLGRFHTFIKHRDLFFSLKPGHKVYLSFIILPLALFAEVLLFFEGVLLMIFFTYTFYTNDYEPLVFVICLLTTVITIQIISDKKFSHHKNLLLLAPVAWLLFYFMDLVEYQALFRSLRKMIARSHVKWQKWKRVGVFEEKIQS